ncbi:MAG: amidohydrolase family protein [Longimicrobiales bacterium]
MSRPTLDSGRARSVRGVPARIRTTTMNARLGTLLLGALLGAAFAPAAAAQEIQTQTEGERVQPPRGTLLIRDLDVLWTATGEVLDNVSVLVRDGVIREIGADLSAPSGATVIEGRGLTGMPGIVDEHSHVAMASTNEGTAPIVPEVRVIDGLDPDDFGIYRALSGGVTAAQLLHGSSNPIGGQSAIIKMRWGMDDAHKLLIADAPRTVKFALGENVTRKNRFGPSNAPDRFPMSREGVEALYVQAFTAAQEYERAWAEYRRDPEAVRVPPRRDLRLEALVDIMQGRIRVHAHSYRADEILMLMRVAERFGFRIDAFTHVLEGYKVADEMAEHGAGGSTFSDWWMYKLEAFDAIPYNAAVMHEHGVLTSLNSDIPWLQSFMVYEMIKPVKYGGISKQDAMQMLTLNPAKQLRLEHRIGSIEIGKDGDFVLLNGDPFDTYTRVEKTIVDGLVYYDREREEDTRGEPVRGFPVITDVAAAPGTNGYPGGNGGNGEAAAPRALDSQERVTALVGATVHPVSGPTIESGVVLLQGDRIAAVGSSATVEIPAGAERIELTGKHVYPGLIDPHTQLGLVEIGSWNAARDDREVGRYNPHVRALFGINPHSEAIPVARANGITSVVTVPASGVVRGAGSLVQLAGDTPEIMEIEDRAALFVDFPAAQGEAWDEPKLEGERLEELLALFERARLYAERPSTSEDPTRPFEANTDASDQILLESMVPAMAGQMPVFFLTRRERDIRTLLMFLDEFPTLRAVIVGGDQAFRVAPELARRNIAVIVGSALRPAMDRDDPVTAGWRNASILHDAGVTVAFTTGDVADVRNLPYHAARAISFGLPPEVGLRAVTLSTAEILGLAGELGSLDAGKRADLIVTTGDPLQITTQVERAFIAGQEVPLTSRHTRLYEQFRDRRSAVTATTNR